MKGFVQNRIPLNDSIIAMKTSKIISFLSKLRLNNTREWLQANKGEYLECRQEFEENIDRAILKISEFDPSISHLTVKDVTYRFNRDTRFSPDKSPYKTHLGAYIAAHGKKALHGGYYIHIEPDFCMLSCGNYWLPTNILTACRNEIMGNIEEWRHCVESKMFLKLFGRPCTSNWGDNKGFGLEYLKTCPAGFPRDYEFIDYLRLKNYCCWTKVEPSFFEHDTWLNDMANIFKAGKPMMDFINNVIDDYE